VEWSSCDGDHQLALASRADPEAFGILYDRYVDRIFAYCYRRLQTRAGAEDATSQTFLKAFAGLPGYRPDATSFRAWLFAIAHRVVIDSYRSGRLERPLDLFASLRMTGPGPEDSALASEADRELYALVDQLPPEQEHLIQLRLSGLTDREIASVLGRSYGAVRTAQHRAIQRLKVLNTKRLNTTGSGR
jgi:RNA polymerase sigma-70 factor (ECF subfamily)